MADYRNIDAKARNESPQPSVDTPTVRAGLALVQDTPRDLDPDVLAFLHAAAADRDQGACCRAVQTALAQGVSPEDMADHYIPQLAIEMGEQWCSDEIGFVDVTIGVSRLQMMLRYLGSTWAADQLTNPCAPTVLLIVPQDAHHTLGALVLAGQLRRKGFSVCLNLGLHANEIATKMQQSEFDAVFISASQSEKLASLRKIVDVIKGSTQKPPPVVIGGAILDVQTSKNLKIQTGANHATKRLEEALRLCGLRTNLQDSIKMMHRT